MEHFLVGVLAPGHSLEAGCINSVVFKDPLKLFPLEDTGRGVQRRLEHVQIMHNGECNTAVLKLPHEFCKRKKSLSGV